MTLVTMSNPPGLDLAILGNPGGKSRRRVKKRSNPAAKKRTTKKNKKGASMATKKKRSGRKRTKAFYRKIGKKGARARWGKKRRSRKPGYKRGKTNRRRYAKSAKRWVGRTWKTKRYGPRTIKSISARHAKRGRRYRRKAYARKATKSGRKGTVRVKARVYRRGRRGSRITHFTNPSYARRRRGVFGGYLEHLIQAPQDTLKALQGKNTLQNALWLSGGMAGTYIAGGYITNSLSPMLARLPGAGPMLTSGMGKRVVAGLMPYTIGFFASKMVKNKESRMALITGGAISSIISFLMPDAIDRLLGRIGLAQMLPPPQGAQGFGAYQALAGHFGDDTLLAGYVEAPSYAGTEGYVEAPGYAGVGEDMLAGGQGVQGYVEAPGYAGTQGVDGYLDSNYLNQGYLAGA